MEHSPLPTPTSRKIGSITEWRCKRTAAIVSSISTPFSRQGEAAEAEGAGSVCLRRLKKAAFLLAHVFGNKKRPIFWRVPAGAVFGHVLETIHKHPIDHRLTGETR